jgi:hypothetical protein
MRPASAADAPLTARGEHIHFYANGHDIGG